MEKQQQRKPALFDQRRRRRWKTQPKRSKGEARKKNHTKHIFTVNQWTA